MRTIRPSSRLLPLAWEITDTKTTSPGRAPRVLSGAIKISLSFSSTVTKPKPLDVELKEPLSVNNSGLPYFP